MKTLGSPDKDEEVVSRATRLDEFYKVEQEWRAQLAVRQGAIESKVQQQEQLLQRENGRAGDKFKAELKRYELKVFLLRLLFVGPVLG